MKRAIEKYDVNVIGLTLSKNQRAYTTGLLDEYTGDRSYEVLLEGWEQFHRPVDRIVSIEAFEHFGFERYDDFFKNCFDIMPDDGRMTIQSTTSYHPYDMAERGKKITFEALRFVKFIITEIFPGGRLPSVEMVKEKASEGKFTLTREQSLQMHYAKTLDIWAEALEKHKDEAIAVQSEEVYERYMKYLTGCAKLFRQGQVDVCQFTCEK